MPHECVDCGEVCDDGSSDVFEGCPSCGGTKFFYVREVTDEDGFQPDDQEFEPAAENTDDIEDEGRASSDVVDDEETATPQSTGGQSTLSEIADAAEPAESSEAETQEATDAVEIEDDAVEHTSQRKARAVTVGEEDDLDTGWPDSPDEAESTSTEDADIVEASGEYERAFGGKLQSSDEADGDDIVEASADADSSASVSDGETGETITRGDTTYERVDGRQAKQELAAEFETIKIVEPGSYELNLMNLYDRDEKIIALEEDGCYQVSLPTFDE